jgi:hypothetical protein
MVRRTEGAGAPQDNVGDDGGESKRWHRLEDRTPVIARKPVDRRETERQNT